MVFPYLTCILYFFETLLASLTHTNYTTKAIKKKNEINNSIATANDKLEVIIQQCNCI